jgi:hypothetical protein
MLLVMAALARAALARAVSCRIRLGMEQLGGHQFCTRRACGLAWGTTTSRHTA